MVIFGSRKIRYLITAEQLRAARGLLGWSQTELALQAGLSLPTVRRVETASGSHVSDEAREKLRRAFDAAGIKFLDENGGGAGVRFRKPGHMRLKGTEAPSSKSSGRTSGARGTAQSMLPQGSSMSRPNGLLELYKPTLSSELLRGARGLLRWTQQGLSAASLVSLATIKRLEAGQGVLAANATTVAALRRALEAAGIEFTGGSSPGVKLRGAALQAAPQGRRGRRKERHP